MNFKNSIGKYLVGIIAGIALVVGCGGGGGGGGRGLFNSADAAPTTGVTAQMFCIGPSDYMAGTIPGGSLKPTQIRCMSNTNSTQLAFRHIYEIAQQGWIMAHVSTQAGLANAAPSAEDTFIFYKN